MAVELFANGPQTTLSAAITTVGQATCSVTSAAAFSAASTSGISQFRILIDSEIIIVTNVSGTTFTITRGAEGTTAATHLINAPVTQIVTRDALYNRAYADTSANRPTAVGSGLIFKCQDIPVEYLDDPVSKTWKQFVGSLYTPAPAAAGSYTASSLLALNNFADVVRASLYTNSPNTGECALLAGSLPSAGTWVVNLVGSWCAVNNTTFPEFGVAVSNGTTAGASTARSFQIVRGTSYGFHQTIFTLGGTRGSVNAEVLNLGGTYDVFRCRILCDGTNLHYQMSTDGFHWWTWFCESSAGLGLTNYGFMIGMEFNTGVSWSQALIYRNDLTTLTSPQIAISTASATSPISIGTTTPHGFQSGDLVAVHGVATQTNANSGTGNNAVGPGAFAWPIQVTGASSFTLIGSTFSGGAGSGGKATLVGR